jgi:prepilin-type N-terminal cleavage/methylation domain-containing protein
MVHTRSRRVGFTLVELLVVIGIIALLISILLPALNRARDSAATIKCLATMRNLGQATLLYANDYKQTLPPAYYEGGQATSSGNNAVNDDAGPRVFTWWSLVRKFMRGKSANLDNSAAEQSERFMQAFFCASGQRVDGGNDFAANPTIYVDLQRERFWRDSGYPFAVTVVKTTSLDSETIIMWDAPEIGPDFLTQYVAGYEVGWRDGGTLMHGFDAIEGSGGRSRFRGAERGDEAIEGDDVVIAPGPNRDITATASGDGLRGNIRWRHGRDKKANFLFGDMSARTLDITRAASGTGASLKYTGDLKMGMFRPKKYPGVNFN